VRKAVVVCGPTASGKSALADALAEEASSVLGADIKTILVDSAQVYREIPVTTNQARGRPADLVGVVSVAEEWNVARHRDAALAVVGGLSRDLPFVVDAGTGMYLNAVVLDLPLAPKVPPEVRAEAERRAGLPAGGVPADPNLRRRVREFELRLAGFGERGSVWSAPLRFDATLVYLRPDRAALDARIGARSTRMVREALPEAEALRAAMERDGLRPNASVREAVGVREMLLRAEGGLTEGEAADEISRRTRRLARRQLRWFDKLARTLTNLQTDGASHADRVRVVEGTGDHAFSEIMHCMRVRMGL